MRVALLLLVACGGPGTPVADAPAIVTLDEDTPDPVEISVIVEDESDLEKYVVEISELPEHGEIDVSEGSPPLRLTYTPEPDFFGTDLLGYTIRGKHGEDETHGAVVLVIEPAPDAPTASDDAVTTPERAPLEIDVVGNDVDPDEDLLVVTDVGVPTSGTVAIVGAGTVLYTPVVGVLGQHTFEYTIEDPSGRSASATVTVTVTEASAVAITSFTASPAHPDPGDPVQLAWTTTAATSCALDPGGVAVETSSSTVVHPEGAVTYVLTCEGPSGPAVAGVSVLPWSEDADADGINDLRELDLGLDPSDPDTDADGVYDGAEVRTDALDPDSDDDGWADGEEDLDRDGMFGGVELDPADPDTDGDGVCDGPRVDGDGDGIGPTDGCADPDVWFVKFGGSGNGTSWGQAFGTLQAAFGAAADGDHVWIGQGTYLVGTATLADDLHVIGGFAGDEAALSARHGQATVLGKPASGTFTDMLVGTGVDVTLAWLSTSAYDGTFAEFDGSDVRLLGLDVANASVVTPAPAIDAQSTDLAVARSAFRGLPYVALSSDGGDVAIADVAFDDSDEVFVAGGSLRVDRSRWNDTLLAVGGGADAVLADVAFARSELALDEASDATLVDARFDGPGQGVSLDAGSSVFATGVTFWGKDIAVMVCSSNANFANTVFFESVSDLFVVCAPNATTTVIGSASDGDLPGSNTLLTEDPFDVYASGEVLLDPEGQAVGVGSEAAANGATHGYPAVGFDWRVRTATSDLLPDAAPVDPGAHFDRSAPMIRTLSVSLDEVAWDVVNARTCRMTGPGIDLVLDAPTTGQVFVSLTGGAEVVLRCEGHVGLLPVEAAALAE